MKIKYILPIVCMFFLLTAFGKQKIKVGLVVNDKIEQSSEIESLKKLLDKYPNEFTAEYIPLDKIGSRIKGYDIIWYHRPDSIAIQPNELNAAKAIANFVSQGGKLILSMEAVRLLNTWNIEPAPIQTKYFMAQDEGFGRKVGFHAFREHAIFDKLFGGAYTWHGKEDNNCRILGFFGDTKPQAKQSQVIGTLWEYIFYHPQDKIVWETPYGKGNILSIGGCLYYAKSNFHTQILEQFTRNCLDYICENKSDVKNKYWTYNPAEVLPANDTFVNSAYPAPNLWQIAPTTYSIERKATSYYFDLPSQRSVIVGSESGGIEEIWTHPFMSLRDYRVYLDVQGIDTLIPLKSSDAKFEIRSNAIIRTYQINDILLKEIITSNISQAGSVVHYQWQGNGLQRIITDFKSNLRFMWPYDELALGSIYNKWSDELNAFVVMDGNKEFCSLVGSNVKGKPLAIGQFDNIVYDTSKQAKGIGTDKLQVAAAVSYNLRGKNALDILMVASNTGTNKVVEQYNTMLQNPQAVFKQSAAYYDQYLANHFSISTPDSIFNESFKWATLSSAQFIVITPGIGTSLMAGYSSSKRGWGGAQKVSGRPGYAWYFGRDAVWAGFAFNDMGDFSTVKHILETLIRFQQVDGKIYHELTSSGSVHFDASDATPLFINLMAHYLRNSGDLEFVKSNMNAIHKAMDYCYSTDTDGDGLIEITNVGHGWLEGGALYGSHTEFYLVGIWNAALEDAAYLSKMTHNLQKENQYSADAKLVNKTINNDFWNKEGYYNYGKKADGSFTDEAIILATVPVYFGVTDSDKSDEMMKLFGTATFSADWGMRMLNDSHKLFDPGSYHFGSVWPLFTGWTSLAEYKTGRYNQAFTRIMSNLNNYKNLALGRIPEVLNGSVYKSGGVTLHQCWSETMAIQPVIEGMLGFEANALDRAMTLAPRIPFDWKYLDVKNLRIGTTLVSFDMNKREGKTIYTFSTNQAITTQFNPTFAPGTQIKSVSINGKKTEFKALANAEYVTIEVPVYIINKTIVEVEYTEGMSVLPVMIMPKIDKPSSGFSVLEQTFKDKSLIVTVEGHPDTLYQLEFYLPNGYKKMEGVSNPREVRKNVYLVDILFDKEATRYTSKKIIITSN